MNEIKTSKGVLKYRLPNILEIYDIVEGTSSIKGDHSMMKIRREIIARMSPIVDYSGIKDVSSYEDMLNDPDNFFAPLRDIADVLIAKMSEVITKKS